MTPRLRISSINEKQLNKRVTLNGWVRTRRGSKGISFIQLYDGSNQNGIQAVADEVLENYEEISRLTTGTSVSITGKVVESPAKGQAFEIHVEKVRVIGTSSGELYPLQKKGLSLEFLREIAHLHTRTNTLGAVFRLRNTLSWGPPTVFFRNVTFSMFRHRSSPQMMQKALVKCFMSLRLIWKTCRETPREKLIIPKTFLVQT